MNPQKQLEKMYLDVLTWNVMFGVPLLDENYTGMGALLAEEYKEYGEAASEHERQDALGDMLVVILGICARTQTLPHRCPEILARANKNKMQIKVDANAMHTVLSDLHSGSRNGLSEFIEILLLQCEAEKIDIDKVFNTIMAANWKKYWTEAELPKKNAAHTVKRVGGIVVYSQAGKIQKPPSFVHPSL